MAKMLNGLRYTITGFIPCDPIDTQAVVDATHCLEAIISTASENGMLLSKEGEFTRIRAPEMAVAEGVQSQPGTAESEADPRNPKPETEDDPLAIPKSMRRTEPEPDDGPPAEQATG